MHNIILTKTLEQELAMPRFRLEGWFTVELIDARTGLIKRRLHFKNLIVNSGLDAVGTQAGNAISNLLTYCEVGTGSTAPAVTQTTLVTPVTPRTSANGGIADVGAYVAGPPDYYYLRRVRLFTETEANGNLTEVGFFTTLAAGTGTMFTRQLFKDGTGTPTVITKTSADQLRITYELRVYPPTADVVLPNITLDGVAYTPTVRALGVDESLYWGGGGFLFHGVYAGNVVRSADAFETDVLVARTDAFVAGSGSAQSSTSQAAYVALNFYRDRTSIWEPGVANFATGIGMVLTMNAQSNNQGTYLFQVKFAPKIAKTNVKRLTLAFRETWGRYP